MKTSTYGSPQKNRRAEKGKVHFHDSSWDLRIVDVQDIDFRSPNRHNIYSFWKST